MAIFSRKSKAEKAAKKTKADEPPPTEKPASETYRHVPRHAASDSVAGASAARDKQAEMERIMAASQQRMAGMTSNRSSTSLRSAHMSQLAAHNAMHGTPSPSSFAAQQQRRPYYGMNGRSPSQSAEVFTTDPDAPPLPSSSSQKHHSASQRPSRNNSGYFASSGAPAPSFDGPSLSNPKMAAAARDRGYVGNPHNSADSGYGSAAASSAQHSRAPSEINAMQDNGQTTHLSQKGSSGFLPQMSLSEELAQEPAFSEHSFSDDQPLEMAPHPKSQEKEKVMRRTTSYVSQLDPASDHTSTRATKQSKPSRSSMKQTRFVAPADPMSEYAQNQSAANSASSQEDGDVSSQSTAHPQHSHSATDPHQSEADAVLPNFDFEQPKPRFSQSQRTSSPARPTYSEPKPSFSRPMRTTTPPPARIETETQNFAPSNPSASVALPTRYHDMESQPQHQFEQNPSYRPMPQQSRVEQSQQAPVMNPNRKRRTSTLPPVSILEGFKVNKKGRVLDEEGEPIGELAEGDIIDCVRQKVNGLGQVMDEYGSIVGQVRTLPRLMMSPSMQAAKPAVGMNSSLDRNQSQQYPQHDTMSPVGGSQGTEAMLQPQHQRHAQEQIASPVPHVINRPAVYPLEFPDDVTRLELDGSTHAEAVPIMDHSEIFAPPFVPSRSPKRDRSPTVEQISTFQEVTTPQPPGAFSTTPAPESEMIKHRPRRWASRNFEDVRDVSEPVSSEESEEPRAPSPIQYQQIEPPARSVTPPVTQVHRSEDTQALRDLEGAPYQEPNTENLPQQSPAIFAYKGDIPATDGPPPGVRLSVQRPPSIPQAPNFMMRQSLTTNGPFSPPASAYNMNSAPGAPVGRFSTMAPGPRPALTAKNSLHMPVRKSPLSSSQSTPPESDDGYHDGTTVQTTYSRPQSLRSMSTHSTTTNTKTRTYFTHSGRMTVDGSKPIAAKAPPTISEIPQPSNDAASTKSGKTPEKKKGRFSLSLGRKGSAVAAH